MNEFNIDTPAIADMLVAKGYHYLPRRNEDEPYHFIGTKASNCAFDVLAASCKSIPVDLSVMEIYAIKKLLNEHPMLCKYYGVGECAEKLEKARFDEEHRDLLDAIKNSNTEDD